MYKVFVLAIAMVAANCAGWSVAQDLTIGSKAPKLEVKKFIKGDPIKGFEKGKIYVVEFWATWCGPCIATIPHLSKLQKEYKDVTFVGVAILEDDQDEVEAFVEKMGEKMEYRVAVDSVPEDGKSDEGAMVKNWMEPAELQGIPAAFIVNGEGVVAWVGHPGEIDSPLEKIVKGKWDIAQEVEKITAAKIERKKLEGILTQVRKLFGEFQEKGDPDELLKALDAAAKTLPDRATQFTLIKFQVLASPNGDVEKALTLGTELIDSDFSEDADTLNNMAWMLVSPEREKKADPKLIKFAIKVAVKADQLKKQEDPSIADTLAKAYFDAGQLDKAVETQERVVKLLPGTELEGDESVKKRLRQYKRALEASKTDANKK